MALTRQELLAADDSAVACIEAPLLGGTVRVVALSGADWASLKRKREAGQYDEIDLIGWLLVLSCIDESGAPIFTEADLPDLRRKPARTLIALGEAILNHNGMGPADDLDAALEKN